MCLSGGRRLAGSFSLRRCACGQLPGYEQFLHNAIVVVISAVAVEEVWNFGRRELVHLRGGDGLGHCWNLLTVAKH